MTKDFSPNSIDGALNFAVELSAIVVGEDKINCSARDEAINDTKRFSCILDLLIKYTPTVHASLWKLKDRAQQASLLALPTDQFEQTLQGKSDYVVPFSNSEVRTIISELRNKQETRYEGVNLISFPRLNTDGICQFSDDAIKACGQEVRHLACMFGSICQPSHKGTGVSNFLLHIAVCGEEKNKDSYWIPNQILTATRNKIVSGICALIDRKTKRITDKMTSVDIAKVNAGANLAIQSALEEVIPRFIKCTDVLRIVPGPDGSYDLAMNVNTLELGKPKKFTTNEISEFGHIIEREFGARPNGNPTKKRGDSILPTKAVMEEIKGFVKLEPAEGFKSLLFGRIHNRTSQDSARGYIVLINRYNELSMLSSNNEVSSDFFDWEDETYLNHMCSVLDLIAELFTAEESRLNRAHIFSHEMHAPTGFIFATAQRLHQVALGRKTMPERMQAKELEDLLLYSELQTNLIDHMMIGLQPGSSAPNSKYRPKWLDLNKVSENTRRLLMPACRRWNVNASNIKMRNLARLFIDERAINQIFMNLSTNAVKYAFSDTPDDFKLTVFCELVPTHELEALNIPAGFMSSLDLIGCKCGHLITFEDYGIGVGKEFSERMFSSGAREQNNEILSRLGAGIGLSVVRAIMRDHFGDIWIDSLKNPTTFSLFFPDVLQSTEYTRRPEWRGVTGDGY